MSSEKMELFAINSRGGIFTKLALIVLLHNPEYQLLTSLASTLAFVQVAFHKFRDNILQLYFSNFLPPTKENLLALLEHLSPFPLCCSLILKILYGIQLHSLLLAGYDIP